jgi:hypothetical protein
MIDSIKLFSKDVNYCDLAFLEEKYGLNYIESNDGYYSYSTQIDNISIKIDNNGTHIEGSAPKYLNKNNIETLKYSQVDAFISSLSDATGSDVSALIITRIDITDNIHVANSPIMYKRHLGKCRYFQRVDYELNGVQYVNKTRKHTFYDKLLEQKNTGVAIPKEYESKNLLRYEVSIMKRRKDHLGEKITTLNDLTVSENYLLLVDKWDYMFDQIEKISFQPTLAMPYRPGMHPMEFYSLLGVKENGGITKATADINENIALGHFTKRIGNNCIKNLNKYQDRYNSLSDGDYLDRKEELIAKFKQKVKENKNI